MNDRFKFRMYDTNVNKMYTPNDFEEVESIYECIKQQINWDLDVDYDIKFNHIEDGRFFMQCTGLKDKNGRLIYEGDIVQSDFDFITNTINPLRFNIGNVIYSDYIAGFVIASDINDYSPYKTSFFGKTEASNCIVIGNIYENPELLKECENE